MKIIFLLFILFYSSSFAQSPNSKDLDKKIVISVLGDSLSSGYGLPENTGFSPILEKYMKKNGIDVIIVDDSIDGNTSEKALRQIYNVSSTRPDLVILQLGAGDIIQGVDPKDMFENLNYIIQQLNEQGIVVLLTGIKLPDTHPNSQTYKDLYDLLAIKNEIHLYPFFMKGVALKPEFNLSDGMHPNVKGVDVIVNNIGPFVIMVSNEIINIKNQLNIKKK